jgi:hypothetical protein
MRKIAAVLTIAALLTGAAAVAAFAEESKKAETTVTGYITDSMCKGEGAKPGHRDCALKCAKEKGGKLGVWDAAASMFYALDDQKKAMEFAGEVVTVTGTLDEVTGTLKVTSIAKAEKKND